MRILTLNLEQMQCSYFASSSQAPLDGRKIRGWNGCSCVDTNKQTVHMRQERSSISCIYSTCLAPVGQKISKLQPLACSPTAPPGSKKLLLSDSNRPVLK